MVMLGFLVFQASAENIWFGAAVLGYAGYVGSLPAHKFVLPRLSDLMLQAIMLDENPSMTYIEYLSAQVTNYLVDTYRTTKEEAVHKVGWFIVNNKRVFTVGQMEDIGDYIHDYFWRKNG